MARIKSRPTEYKITSGIVRIRLKRSDGITKIAWIDESDLHILDSVYLKLSERQDGTFVVGTYQKGNRSLLHRLLLKPENSKIFVDRINNNSLDNRRCNLRLATNSENQQNRRGAQINSKSGVRGVYWCNQSHRWIAKVIIGGKHIRLGHFKNISDAEAIVVKYRSKYMPFSKEFGGTCE